MTSIFHRWFCHRCQATGRLVKNPEFPGTLSDRIKGQHARQSPGCPWDEDAVTVKLEHAPGSHPDVLQGEIVPAHPSGVS